MTTKHVLVTGDFVVDHHIYEGRRQHYGDRVDRGVRLHRQLGGAALIHFILKQLLAPETTDGAPASDSEWTTNLAIDERSALTASGGNADHAYAFWRPMPRKAPVEKQFWRASEAMGFGGDATAAAAPLFSITPIESHAADIVVISEGGMGFRRSAAAWPKKSIDRARWIVLKTTAPLEKDSDHSLLTYLSAPARRRRLIALVTARDLRKSSARISAGLSWEETVQDLCRELGANGALTPLTMCRHLIVTFGTEGALWIDMKQGFGPRPGTPLHLVYDAATIEGDHGFTVEGSAFGFSSCLTAAIAWQLTREPDSPDLAAGLEAGLSAMRELRELGHGPASEVPEGFPFVRLAASLRRPARPSSRATFPFGAPQSDVQWTLLHQSQRNDAPAVARARLVLLRGPIALANLPHLRIGNLISADRREIEALRLVIQAVRHYQAAPQKKPLSIGVFGPPGAGKSFAVRELADGLVGDGKWMEFNLSQFRDGTDLIGAFHQIRDEVLQGRLPIAFFDEFDSERYQWLRLLLAPMQDGRFQEGQATHAIGKCIMVFAGGTSWTFETFGPPKNSARHEQESTEYGDFRLAKGPDFASRFDVYLNVVGPNRRSTIVDRRNNQGRGAELFGGRWFVPDSADDHFQLRRALMIRAELKCKPDDKLDIDDGLVRALLEAERYTHGARSLGKVLQSLAAARPGRLQRSLLAPRAQLDMHTAADKFLDLCEKAPTATPTALLDGAEIERIAPVIHDYYRQLGRKENWLKPENDCPFSELGSFKQESNRQAARRMVAHLPMVDLRLVPGRASASDDAAIRTHLEYSLELLAEAEHDGWMMWHFAQEWRYGAKVDEAKKRHNCLRPYTQLPKAETDKDRDTVRHYPNFARAAGLKIVFAHSAAARRAGA